MRPLVCLALAVLIAAPIVSSADDPPPSPESEQAKGARQTTPSTPESPADSNPTPPEQAGPSTPAPAPDPTEAYEQWLRTLQPLPEGGWRYLTTGLTNSDQTVLYYSTHHIGLNGSMVTAWFRWEYQHDIPDGLLRVRSLVTRDRIDCASDAEMPLSQTAYSQQNMRGTASAEEVDPKSALWTPIIPGSLGEAELNWACDKVLKNAQQRKGR
jgi:Surface-adhesin protein E